MSQIRATKQADFITCPQASAGAVVAVVSGVAQSINLSLIGNQVQVANIQSQQELGVQDHYVSIQAQGANLYVIFGLTQASVTSGNAPVATTTGTGTVQTPAPGIAFWIPQGATANFLPRPTVDGWMGFVSDGAGFMRIFQTSY